MPSPWFAIESKPYACRTVAGARPETVVAEKRAGFVWNGGRAKPFGTRVPSTYDGGCAGPCASEAVAANA